MTKVKAYLLDCNVLIALATPEHGLNARAPVWTRRPNPGNFCWSPFRPFRGTNSGRTMSLTWICPRRELSGTGR